MDHITADRITGRIHLVKCEKSIPIGTVGIKDKCYAQHDTKYRKDPEILEDVFYCKSLIKFAKYTHNTEKIRNFVFGF